MPRKLFQHKKTRGIYVVVNRCLLEADAKTMMIVYQDYPAGNNTWVRPEDEFLDGRFQCIGDAPDPQVFDPLADILEFHQKFDIDYTGAPRALPADIADFRRKFMQEELDEYGWGQNNAYQETTRPSGSRDVAEYTHQLEQCLDALVDEMYVVLGTAHLHGFQDIFAEAWRRVHAANMAKVRADLDGSNSKRGSSFDVVKPAGWEPPVHTDLVEGNDIHEPHFERA